MPPIFALMNPSHQTNTWQQYATFQDLQNSNGNEQDREQMGRSSYLFCTGSLLSAATQSCLAVTFFKGTL